MAFRIIISLSEFNSKLTIPLVGLGYISTPLDGTFTPLDGTFTPLFETIPVHSSTFCTIFAVFTQPLASVPVTIYVVVIIGETEMLAPAPLRLNV